MYREEEDPPPAAGEAVLPQFLLFPFPQTKPREPGCGLPSRDIGDFHPISEKTIEGRSGIQPTHKGRLIL